MEVNLTMDKREKIAWFLVSLCKPDGQVGKTIVGVVYAEE